VTAFASLSVSVIRDHVPSSIRILAQMTIHSSPPTFGLANPTGLLKSIHSPNLSSLFRSASMPGSVLSGFKRFCTAVTALSVFSKSATTIAIGKSAGIVRSRVSRSSPAFARVGTAATATQNTIFRANFGRFITFSL